MKGLNSIANPFKQNRFLGRMAVVLPALLVVTVLVAPTSYAGSGATDQAQQGQGKSSPNGAYVFYGDAFNPGNSTTTSISSGGGPDVWYFLASAPSGATRGLTGDCNQNNGSCMGVYGKSGAGASGAGVFGTSSGSNSAGVWGVANNGTASAGIYGGSTIGKGVWGYSSSGDGLYGASSSGNGAYASSNSATGVGGVSNSGIGLYGQSTTGSGFYGFSSNGPGGVMGSNTTEGARFYTRNASSYAVVTGGIAGTYGNVYIGGNYQATGTKSARVETSQGARLMYATEGTQNIFSDQGTAQLVNGRAIVTIDPLFAQTVSLNEGYQVFVTPGSLDTAGLGVINQTTTSFEVGELSGGKGNFSFHWKVEALRKGYEKDRLEDAGPAPASSGKVYELPVMAPAPAQKPER